MSIADMIHHKQLELDDIGRTLRGINPALELATRLRRQQQRLIDEIRELEAQRTKHHEARL